MLATTTSRVPALSASRSNAALASVIRSGAVPRWPWLAPTPRKLNRSVGKPAVEAAQASSAATTWSMEPPSSAGGGTISSGGRSRPRWESPSSTTSPTGISVGRSRN